MIELTILMPCLNEQGTVGVCVKTAKGFLEDNEIEGEVVVADNGSTDNSASIAREAGAMVVSVPEKGYGRAIMGGVREASGKHIIVGDADESYDFSAIKQFLDDLRAGADIVMGNRFSGEIKGGAMPAIHKYIGNPGITMLGNILFGYICGDYYCGLRGFKREAILDLGLKGQGMQFAVEMLIRAKRRKLKIKELPITLYKAPASHKSHIEMWKDGWKTILLLISIKING